MSLANTINQAVLAAKTALGDLVNKAVLRVMTDRQYVNGQYIKNYTNVDVEVVVDKFSYHEQMLPSYQQTDVKLYLFNPNGDLNPTIQDMMTWNGKDLAIIKAEPVYVGTQIPMWTIVLRQ